MDAVNAFNGEVRIRVLFAFYRLPLAERARQAPPKQSLFICLLLVSGWISDCFCSLNFEIVK